LTCLEGGEKRPKLVKLEKIPTNTNEIQRMMREYFENLYSNKVCNLEKVDNL
jgi:hypothetical protein